jgi:tetratricopeptide (TPR) repeat protein
LNVTMTYSPSILLLILVVTSIAVVSASADATSFGVAKSSKLPGWLSVHNDRELMSQLMGLARHRHNEAIQKARSAYFHGRGKASDDSSSSQILDEYEVKASGKIPDFITELERRLFVTNEKTPLFSAEECRGVISKAEAHFEGGPWTRLPSGQYDVSGFWIRDVPAVHEWFNQMLQERLFPLLVKKFPHFVPDIEDLCVDSAYVFKYTPETGRRTDVHTDSGCLSFTISLNGNDEYSGGGTWFEGLQGDTDIIEMNIGQCTVRPGGVKHCGHAVTEGVRYIIGGFCMSDKKVEYVRLLLGLGSEEFSKGNIDKATQAFEAAIAINPDFDASYSNLADVLTQTGEKGRAREVLEYCLQNVNPQNGEIAYSLGANYLEDRNFEEAKKCMLLALEADESDVEAMTVLAEACAEQHDTSGESHWYQRIVSTPGASPTALGKAYCNLGVMNEGTSKEIEYYEKSIEYCPDRFAPRYSLGCAYATTKEHDKAIHQFREAVDIAEDNSNDQKQALQTLYRVASLKMQSTGSVAASREEAVQKFMEVIGTENYEKLASMGP